MGTTSIQRRRSDRENSRQAAIEGLNEGLEVQPVLEDSDSAEESQIAHAELLDLSTSDKRFTLTSDRQIELLYKSLKQAESEAAAAFRRTTQQYFDLGVELLKRRPDFKRGSWLPWLAERGIEERYAQRSMQIAQHFRDKSDRLSDLSIEDALRQIQKRLPSVEGYEFSEVKNQYDTIKKDSFKFHNGGLHPYSFEIQGFTACFSSLTQAMNRFPALREKYGRIASYPSVDVLPEPIVEPIAESEVERVAASGWIQTKDGRNLNPRHYKIVPAPSPDAIAQVLEASEFISGESVAAIESIPLKVLAAEFCQAHGVIDVAIAVLDLATFEQLDELDDWISERQIELRRHQRDETAQ